MDKTTEVATDADGRPLDMDAVPSSLRGPLGKYQKYRRNFYVVIGVFVAGFLLNAVAGDLYESYKPWKKSEDAFVQQIADGQKAEFEKLRNSLADIRSNLPSDSRDTLASIERTLANVERDSAGLVQQLDLARREIETVRAVSINRGGVGGGYDFTLAEGTSMDLASPGLVGLQELTANGEYAYVNLSSGVERIASRERLAPGESLKYTNGSGRECWVALRSLHNGEPGSASFNTGCS